MLVEILNEQGKEMSPKCKELALMAGGSHYPRVGGETLEQFMRLTVEECIKILQKREVRNSNSARLILKEHFGLEKSMESTT
jgi:hypothetical protein